MFERSIENELFEQILDNPAVALVGPRQVGKTTLVKNLQKRFERPSIYLDLESNADLVRLQDAELYLDERRDSMIILDEIQRMPSLFPLIRFVDRPSA
jgi:predicted AAA+ superfamily ATPase